MTIKTDNANLNAALAYSRLLDWHIFPIRYKDKAPLTSNGFHSATNDIEQIKRWWKQWPNAGIGLSTGKINNIVVIDVDPRNNGHLSLERLLDEHGIFPDTVHCLTGGNGDHYYFKHDERINKSKLDDYEGIDIQGNGKYVILPPSVHPNGRSYEWEASSKPVITPVADIPDWLIHMMDTKQNKKQARPTKDYLNILQGGSEGNRNNSLMSLIGHLLAKKIDYQIAYELVVLWNERNNPPLSVDEVTRAFNNMLNKEAAKRR